MFQKGNLAAKYLESFQRNLVEVVFLIIRACLKVLISVELPIFAD